MREMLVQQTYAQKKNQKAIENWTTVRISKFHKRECVGISYLPLKLSIADIVERAARVGLCSLEKEVVNLTKTGSS